MSIAGIFSVTESKSHKIFNFAGIKLRVKSYTELDKKINQDISKYKYIHIMFNNKFNKPFVDFLNSHFNPQEHMILCHRAYEDKEPTLFPRGENVYEYVHLDKINLNKENIDKIICHSLFPAGLVNKLYKEKNLLKKSYWVIWGGDLYNAPRDKKNDFVRKNFKGYIGTIDKEFAISKYGMKSKFYEMYYKFPLTKEMLDSVNQTQNDYVKIQVNNSCDDSTLEILDILSKFKDKNIKITTILSYGKLEYKDKIIEKGKEIFGDKFEYLDNLLTPREYANYIAQNDILILNQNRQQGFGNILAALYLGVKVFVKSNISTNIYLNNEGIKIYDTEDIQNNSFENFIEYNMKAQNKETVKKYFDDDYLKKLLENIFIDDTLTFINLKTVSSSIKKQILNWRNSNSVSKYFQIPYIDKQTHKEWLKKLDEVKPNVIAFLVKNNTNFIGLTYFSKINYTLNEADWGLYIYTEQYRHKGYGKIILKQIILYAQNSLKLNRIYLEVLKNNLSAIKLYERFNFVRIYETDKIYRYELSLTNKE